MSEAQKYQGALYRPEKEKKGKGQQNNKQQQQQAQHRAYVEDTAEVSNAATPEQILPEAPTSPSAAPGFQSSNVFAYMVDSETPNASTVKILEADTTRMIEDTPIQDASETALVAYENGSEDASGFATPAPKTKKSKDSKSEERKDKKRKRLHVDTDPTSMELVATDGDEVMGEAPPVLHSGLTGGLNRLLTRPSEFPPSPDYSGAEPADGETSPVAPVKKAKKAKTKKPQTTFTGGLLAMMAPKKPKKKDSNKKQKTAQSSQRMLEFKTADPDGGNQLVVYKQPAEHLMSFVSKAPIARGVSA